MRPRPPLWVSLILDLLASGSTFDEVLANYPGLELADIQACIAYGAEMSRERYFDVPLGAGTRISSLTRTSAAAERNCSGPPVIDVATVVDQGMTSAPDPQLLAACAAEGCCLATLDLDFANPLTFPPGRHAGVVVLRLPPKPSDADLDDACRTLIAALADKDAFGKLWIVQRGRLREYQPRTDDSDDP